MTEKTVKVDLKAWSYFDEDGLCVELGAGDAWTMLQWSWEQLFKEATDFEGLIGFGYHEATKEALWVSDQLRLLADRIRSTVLGAEAR
jgi:hypothetical protein